MPSSTYNLIAKAMAERKQVLCSYDGHPRELCPVILGHTKGREVALTFQFAGSSKSGPVHGQWKCLQIAKVSDIKLRDGPWRAGESHSRPQACVEIVDLDVNPESPYHPRRKLAPPRAPRRRPSSSA